MLLQPKEKLSLEFLKELKQLNAKKNKKHISFVEYATSIARFLRKNDNQVALNENHKSFLGGFICGEGSINVSLKYNQKGSSFRITPSPQFSVTQHINNCSYLVTCLFLFQTGRIYHKSTSNATLVYTIDNRKMIKEAVLPFWKKYILPYQPGPERLRFINFEELLKLLDAKKHLSKETCAFEVLPLWDSLRKQQGQSNERFKNLKEAQDFVLSGK